MQKINKNALFHMFGEVSEKTKQFQTFDSNTHRADFAESANFIR